MWSAIIAMIFVVGFSIYGVVNWNPVLQTGEIEAMNERVKAIENRLNKLVDIVVQVSQSVSTAHDLIEQTNDVSLKESEGDTRLGNLQSDLNTKLREEIQIGKEFDQHFLGVKQIRERQIFVVDQRLREVEKRLGMPTQALASTKHGELDLPPPPPLPAGVTEDPALYEH